MQGGEDGVAHSSITAILTENGGSKEEGTSKSGNKERLEIATCPLGCELAHVPRTNAFLGFQLPSAADTNLEIIISVGGGANERQREQKTTRTDRQFQRRTRTRES